MVYPLLPLYLTTRLGASPSIVGLIEGIAESLASLTKVFSGYVSDRVGRRKPLAIAGYASSTLGKVLFYLSTSWGWILAGRVVDRFGKGVRTAPRDALIADSTDVEVRGRAYGLHRALDTAGASMGVILAFLFLTAYPGDFSAVFLLSLIPAGLGVAVLFLARERGSLAPGAAPLSLRWSSLDRRLRAFLLLTLVFTLGNSSNQFLLLRARNLGFDATTVVLLYLVYNVVYALLSYPAGRLSDRLGRKRLLVAGYLVYGLVYLGFASTPEANLLWGLFAIYGLYVALTESVEKALVADLAPRPLRATVIGLHATIVGAGLLPASVLAGLLWDLMGPAAPFYLGGTLGLAAAIGLWLLI
ncbi:MAG: MFS transporter [Chloroflexi bacterium]|nr:MFS transporter [Chloroflexota bacterium]